jgi:hypothetical protein
MNITAGIILLVVFVAMLWFGKARNGEPRSFMRVWIVGIAYTMTCLISLVMGIALIVLR